MSDNYFEKLHNNPNVRISREYSIDYEGKTYYLREDFTYRVSLNLLKGSIQCGFTEGASKFPFGTIDIDVDKERIDADGIALLKNLYVPEVLEGMGVGTQLMFAAFFFIKDVKEYYHIDHTIKLRGWLSPVDNENGNWQRSVPFYHRAGELAGIEHYFMVNEDTNKYLTPDEFFDNIGERDGFIIYVI